MQHTASPVGPGLRQGQDRGEEVTAVGPTCGRAWGSVPSLGGGPGGSLGRGSALGAAPGGDS